VTSRAALGLALLLLSACARADVAPEVWTRYAALTPKKALAVATDGAIAAVGTSTGQSSDAAAAVVAFEACETDRRGRGVAGACDVVRLNDAAVHSGAEIRARLPRARHPLFLWRYDAPGARVYLAGSMHVMKPTLLPLAEPFEAAFAAADRIAVEVDPLAVAPHVMQEILSRHAYLPAGQTLESVLPPTTLKSLERHAAEQGVPFDALARLKPWLIATQLAIDRLTALGYLPEFGVDQHFIARAGSRPVLELERIEDQFALLASPDLALQADMLAVTLEQMPEIEPILADLVVAWLSGDDRALRRLFDATSPQSEAYRAFDQRLLDARNVGMSDRIETYLATPGTTFVLVGAAHLAGDGSIVEQLARRGVEGRRIYSDDRL
jgi:uncharacterized protein YbaP (TraB family)